LDRVGKFKKKKDRERGGGASKASPVTLGRATTTLFVGKEKKGGGPSLSQTEEGKGDGSLPFHKGYSISRTCLGRKKEGAAGKKDEFSYREESTLGEKRARKPTQKATSIQGKGCHI